MGVMKAGSASISHEGSRWLNSSCNVQGTTTSGVKIARSRRGSNRDGSIYPVPLKRCSSIIVCMDARGEAVRKHLTPVRVNSDKFSRVERGNKGVGIPRNVLP